MTSVRVVLFLLLLISAAPIYADDGLCETHDWFSLDHSAQRGKASLLCLGAADASFERRQSALARLHQVIRTDSHGEAAYTAHQILFSLFFRAGQYREALEELDAMLALRPAAEDVIEERPLLLALSRYPDQSVKRKRSVLPRSTVQDGNVHFPVIANSKAGLWFMDTGANISVMSDAEARALGLAIQPVTTQVADISGAKTALQIAEVHELIIGKVHLSHVGFIVLPQSRPPFNDIPTDQQTILGIQVLRSLQTIQIEKSGQIEIGARSHRASGSRLAFDQSIPVIQMSFAGKACIYTFDSGAVHTTLNPPFAEAFPQIVAKGQMKKHTLTGQGGSKQRNSIEIEQLRFVLAGRNVILSPASVLLQQTTATSAWAAGNLGWDLMQQTAPLTIDFRKMQFSSGH
jgi:predicted aspartyl protease